MKKLYIALIIASILLVGIVSADTFGYDKNGIGIIEQYVAQVFGSLSDRNVQTGQMTLSRSRNINTGQIVSSDTPTTSIGNVTDYGSYYGAVLTVNDNWYRFLTVPKNSFTTEENITVPFKVSVIENQTVNEKLYNMTSKSFYNATVERLMQVIHLENITKTISVPYNYTDDDLRNAFLDQTQKAIDDYNNGMPSTYSQGGQILP